MDEDIKVKFSQRIRQLRLKYNYTQQELSELSDLEYKHIQRLESKRPCDVKLTTLKKLSKAFKLSLSKFLNF